MEEDFRIIELFKENSPAAFEVANKAAKKILRDSVKNIPAGNLENFMFWTLLNYYTYQIMQEVIKDIETMKKS